MTDPEQIRTAIRSIVLDKVPNVNDSNWESANLELDDVKFKVVSISFGCFLRLTSPIVL